MENTNLERNKLDERAIRTRRAILEAFATLVPEIGYEHVRVSHIAERAQISRSTFYSHFRGKDDLLKHVVEHLFLVLAGGVCGRSSPRELREALQHTWDQRSVVRGLLHGTTLQRLTRLFAALIREQLIREYGESVDKATVELRSIRAAGGRVALIRAWVFGEIPSDLQPVLDQFVDARLG